MLSISHHSTTGASPRDLVSGPIGIRQNDDVRRGFLEPVLKGDPGSALEVPDDPLYEELIS